MIDLSDEIHQLRCELKNCGFTSRERAAAQARLDQLIAEHAERDRALDDALAALDRAATPMGAAA